MAEKRRFLDVWLIESNTVYREVPFSTVIDWIQEGRLVADDMLRWSGQAEWFRLGGVPAFAAYLPKGDSLHVNDQAEALEPVQLDFSWKRKPEEEEDDVDMIPLIDVSLVLLIFFLMVLGVSATASTVQLPFSTHAYGKKDPRMLWIEVTPLPGSKATEPVYSFGLGGGPPAEQFIPVQDGENGLLARLAVFLDNSTSGPRGPVDVEIKAGADVPAGTVRRLLIHLEADKEFKGKIANTYYGVK